MMMGPEPMMRIFLMSVRLGIADFRFGLELCRLIQELMAILP